MARINPINYREKIIALWTVFLLGTLFHTQLALIPLFHGIDVAMRTRKPQAERCALCEAVSFRVRVREPLGQFPLPELVNHH